MKTDWLDDLLDRDPGETVPAGFAERLRERIAREGGRSVPPLSLARPGHWLITAAAAAVFLAVGFWLGRGRPEVQIFDGEGGGANLVRAELIEMYRNQELLRDLEFVLDGSLELAFQDAAAEAWLSDNGALQASGEEQKQ